MNGPEELDRLPEVKGREREALEAALRRVLCPMDPASGFTETVLRRAEASALSAADQAGRRRLTPPSRESSSEPLHPMPRSQGFGRLLQWPAAHLEAGGAGALIAAALALAVFAGEQNHLKREQERMLAERRAVANQQFEAAVRITDQTVEEIQARVQAGIQAHTRESLRRAAVAKAE